MDSPNSKPSFSDRSYALSGKIMLSAIVVLFFVVILMICLHLYARWYLLRARRRQMRRRSRRQNLVFYVDSASANPAAGVQSRGLDAAVLKSLPVFVYSAADPAAPESMECAVCLSEFEEKEVGRTLPKCGHSFHTECIDMWFHSHSTCPLCRSPVEPVPAVEMVELCDSSRDMEIGTSASVAGRKLRGDLGLEVPGRSFGEEPSSSAAGGVPESPASQGFRSPMSRMLSFTRILSRDWRSNNGYVLSPRSPMPISCGGSMAAAPSGEEVADVDLEAAEDTRPGPS